MARAQPKFWPNCEKCGLPAAAGKLLADWKNQPNARGVPIMAGGRWVTSRPTLLMARGPRRL